MLQMTGQKVGLTGALRLPATNQSFQYSWLNRTARKLRAVLFWDVKYVWLRYPRVQPMYVSLHQTLNSLTGTIQLLAFGITKDIISKSQFPLEWEGAASVLSLKTRLLADYPQLGSIRSLAFAVNGCYADENTLINQGDEVALIPPVSGG